MNKDKRQYNQAPSGENQAVNGLDSYSDNEQNLYLDAQALSQEIAHNVEASVSAAQSLNHEPEIEEVIVFNDFDSNLNDAAQLDANKILDSSSSEIESVVGHQEPIPEVLETKPIITTLDVVNLADQAIEDQESVAEASVQVGDPIAVDSSDAQALVQEIKQEVSKKHKAFESLSAKQKAKLEYKALSREEKKQLKKRAKQIEALNKPHKGPKDVQMQGNNIIELKDVVKYYTNGYVVSKILKGINLSIEKGSFVIILGPSGSGKTTLMNIISGLDRASEGQVYVANKDLITLNHKELTKFRKDNVGYVFQQYGLIPNLTVRENVEIGADLQADKTKRLDVNELLDAVGMTEYANKFPHQLSGGQQQRVSIARAFAKNPSILFGDEPTGAIDEEMSKVVLKQFVAINKKYGTTVIMVTHNPIFQGLGDLVIKVKDGIVSQVIKNSNPKTVDELPWGME